ncbi:NAD(P)-dependent oxidoreductase [uncultured Azohydromonas sp.]|jgi:Nucleoside-diphosphate-sugar epimerases|uniref:NAD-dependent epimerase/dehydratase family protein n=1 Tax=uncultured Azohydromonas sp. TaxID=487342 RepID=UPI00262245CD|nr:NAD-dependent epimerase/dehydratase family protein [uncultured Azohydromonas sp.]
MKIFLTGGTGFVGSHFVNQAHAAGHTLVAQRRPGSRPRVALEREPQWVDRALDGDFSAELAGCDVVVHLASHTPNPPYDTLERCLYWNVQASAALLEQARQAGIARYLCAGSCFEYGRSAARHERIPVTAPLEPTLSYPASKAAAAVALTAFAAEHGLRMHWLRIFQVYGEGEPATRLWPSLRAAAQAGRDFPMTAGDQVRDFIEVGDVAAAFVRALDFEGVEPGVARISHVASGRAQSLAEFARHWWSHWGATGELRLGAVPYRHNELMRLVPEL